MQSLCIPLSLSLFRCILFPLWLIDHPVCPCCRTYFQLPIPSVIHKVDYFITSVVSDETPQLTHPVRTCFAPSHWSGTHTFGINAAYMPFRTASLHMLIMERPLDILPVSLKICPAVFHCTSTSFALVFDPAQKFLCCQKFVLVYIFIKPPFCTVFLFLVYTAQLD